MAWPGDPGDAWCISKWSASEPQEMWQKWQTKTKHRAGYAPTSWLQGAMFAQICFYSSHKPWKKLSKTIEVPITYVPVPFQKTATDKTKVVRPQFCFTQNLYNWTFTHRTCQENASGATPRPRACSCQCWSVASAVWSNHHGGYQKLVGTHGRYFVVCKPSG